MHDFEAAFGAWVVRHRWWLIAATILLVLASASGAQYLTINNDNRVFFSEDNPQLQALEALENTYTKEQIVLFAIAPKNGNVFTRQTLAAIEELTEASWQIPYSARVDSITNFQHTRAEEDDLIVENLVNDAMSLSDADLQRVRAIALSEPLLVNRMISPTGHVTGVSINCLYPGESLEEVPSIASFSRRMLSEFRAKYPGIDFYLTGGVMLDNAFAEAGADDLATLVPIMFLVLLVVTGLALRSFAGTFATFIVILFSMATGMGLAGWLGISLTAASVGAPTIILTLAVADSVHILSTVFQQMGAGKARLDAIAESLRINVQPVFLTSVTTAIGFLSMNFSEAPPFRDLGNIVAMGVLAALVYSVFFLPSLLAILPLKVRAMPKGSERQHCRWLASFVIVRRKQVFWGSLAIVAVLTAGIARIELDDDWVAYFSERYDIRKATDFVQRELTGFDLIEYSLESGESGGISEPDYLARVEAFADWFRGQPRVTHVNSLTEIMKRLNMNMHGDDEAYYRIPDSRELAAQYLLLYELSLPFGLDLNNQINVDKSSSRMSVMLRVSSTTEQRELEAKARAWLKANAPEHMFTYGTGLTMIWAHLSQRNINTMLLSAMGALVLISIILIFALGSIRLGLVSLVPNLAPAFMAFGLWGMAVGQVGLGLSVVVAMTLGIVVDDTVHFISKYLRAHREHNMPPPEAIRYAFHTVGTAMWVTTAALVAGFMVLALSGFRMNADMGLLSAVTILLALALDFLFLPTLLMKTYRKRRREPS